MTGTVVLIVVIVVLIAGAVIGFVRTRRPKDHEIGLPEVGALTEDEHISSAEAKLLRAEAREQHTDEPEPRPDGGRH